MLKKLFENIHPSGVPKAEYYSTVLVKRGNGKDHDYILQEGEIAFNRIDKEFYVGDGKTPIRDLDTYNGIVEGDNGVMYLVRVDKNGIPDAKEVVVYSKTNRKFMFKTHD